MVANMPSFMVMNLISIIVLWLVGLALIIFARSIGLWNYRIGLRINRRISEEFGIEKDALNKMSFTFLGPTFSIWGIRILGMVVVVTAFFVFDGSSILRYIT
jgi:hypothetical protein